MEQTEKHIVTAEQPRGRLKLVFIALLFFGPLAAAALYYYAGGALHPEGRTNAGRLLQPIVNVEGDLGDGVLASLTDGRSEGRWLLIYANEGVCDTACTDALYRMRQSRLMLGRDMTRLVRVFLHGAEAPDKVLSDGEHEGLIATNNSGLGGYLDRKRPADLAPGGLFLIDPVGNLVMYFTAELAPEDMVGDIEHLLDLSRIG